VKHCMGRAEFQIGVAVSLIASLVGRENLWIRGLRMVRYFGMELDWTESVDFGALLFDSGSVKRTGCIVVPVRMQLDWMYTGRTALLDSSIVLVSMGMHQTGLVKAKMYEGELDIPCSLGVVNSQICMKELGVDKRWLVLRAKANPCLSRPSHGEPKFVEGMDW
jgi:hypothetical protein